MAPGMTVAAAQRLMTRELRAAGIDGAERDARLLVAAATGDPAGGLPRSDRPVSLTELERLSAMLERRRAREPVARILGVRGFYGRDFEVTRATLDPRPDTETLADVALEIVDRMGWRKQPLRILDIGTGSGVLLVTLLAELPLAWGTGSDICPEALETAARNAARHHVADRARWCVARSLHGIEGPFDLVVSNPPYIPTGDIAALERDVRDYDPHTALDGGSDGLAIYREIVEDLHRVMPDGWVLLEVGTGQGPEVGAMLVRNATVDPGSLSTRRDLSGHQRCVAARTRSPAPVKNPLESGEDRARL